MWKKKQSWLLDSYINSSLTLTLTPVEMLIKEPVIEKQDTPPPECQGR